MKVMPSPCVTIVEIASAGSGTAAVPSIWQIAHTRRSPPKRTSVKSCGVVVYETEKPHSHWFHTERQQIQAYLDARFPGFHNILVNADEAHRRIVVASYSDRYPVVYSLLRIVDGALELEILANTRPIDPELLAEMQPISFTARDGTLLQGYLTVPPWGKGEVLPLILHPHGGPWRRDSWGYNPVVQFLASRGLAVLQVNFRSSSGYGYAFLHAGDKRWGTDMQDDLVDAVMWAVDEGITERGRIGIYGTSYGGYATMAQLVLHPELYQFGITGVGPVDLIGLINWRRKWKQERAYHFYTRTIGDPETEGALLRRHSPINFIERCRTR